MLDFAAEQARTDSGVLIRDLVFYNSRSVEFLADIHAQYGARQLVFELKNVRELERDHVNQLNRYLNDELGRFGVFVTRNDPPPKIRKSLVDLWAGQRRSIIVLTDEDLELMVSVFDSKQRLPIEVLKRAYVNFTRFAPGVRKKLGCGKQTCSCLRKSQSRSRNFAMTSVRSRSRNRMLR